MIWIGTSGFQYPEWKGTFYPETLSAAKMLPYYAEHFPTSEINYSFYRVPAVSTVTRWNTETPARFRFSFKAPRVITHVKKLRDCADVLNRFQESIQTLDTKLGVVLFQLPPNFGRDVSLLSDFLAGIPRDGRCAFEFRHPSWFTDETFTVLRSANAALCIAESDSLETPVEVTANFGYFRLRKAAYSTAEMKRWAEIIERQNAKAQDVFVYFKHEESGTGPKFARQLMNALKLE